MCSSREWKCVQSKTKPQQGGHCAGNHGDVRENEKMLKWSGKVMEFERERGKSMKTWAIFDSLP